MGCGCSKNRNKVGVNTQTSGCTGPNCGPQQASSNAAKIATVKASAQPRQVTVNKIRT
jgi:hypothetical protein